MSVLRNALIGIFLSSALLPGTAPGQETDRRADWDLKRDRDGIQVYTRDVADSPYDAVRAEMIMEGVRLSALVALIEDYEACPHWADRCAESYLVERLSDRQSLVYTNNDMPFPVQDRDAITHVVWHQDLDTFQVRMLSTAVPDRLEEKRGRVRLREAEVRWEFTPLEDGRVRIVNEAHIDPGSALPGWVTNMLLVDTPYATLESLREEVVNPQYANAEVAFIMEPSG